MLKKIVSIIFLFSFFPISTSFAITPTIRCPNIQVCFTPGENCTAEINDVIDAANQSIFVQAYSFSAT